MTKSRLLLVENNPERAARLAEALRKSEFDSFPCSNAGEASEALTLQQFDVVLFTGSPEEVGSPERFYAALARLSEKPVVIGYGDRQNPNRDGGLSPGKAGLSPDSGFAGFVPAAVSEEELGREVRRLCKSGTPGSGEIAETLPVFDLEAFRQHMGDDDELVREIIGIFREESVQQLQGLHSALSGSEYHSASRIAHSLKGSLGNLHSARARYWAQELESAAAAGDPATAERCFAGLQRALSVLEPELQNLLKDE